jgi:hypothetical protein
VQPPPTHHGRAPLTGGRRSQQHVRRKNKQKNVGIFSKKYWKNVGSTFYEKCGSTFCLKNVVTFVGKRCSNIS